MFTSQYKNSYAIVIVYDITNRNSFENIYNYIGKVDQYGKDGSPLFIWGNKADENTKRVVSSEEGLIVSEKYNAWFFETSAKEDANIMLMFDVIASNFIESSNSSDDK